jgi:hypothetical protein
MKYLIKKFYTYLFAAAFSLPACATAAQNAPLENILPNIHGKSLTTPVGWGSAYGTVFVGVGGSHPAPHSTNTDGAAAIGIGIGNPVKHAGLQMSLSSLDMSNGGRYALNLHLHRYLGSASSIAVGVENIMLTHSIDDDSESSSYIVYSHGVIDTAANYALVYNHGILEKRVISERSKASNLHYSIGVGSGRFSKKSPDDVAAGKGTNGTSVFGNVAYEVFEEFNLVSDWNGTNLNVGVSKTFLISDSLPIVITLGVGDLTSNSGSGKRIIGGIGTGFRL